MTTIVVEPGGRIEGSVRLPGDKSIGHRALLLGAVAEGDSRVDGLPTGADVGSTAAVVRALGVEIVEAASGSSGGAAAGTGRRSGGRGGTRERSVRLSGLGLQGLQRPEAPLDCGNSGTTLRLLAGLLAGQRFTSVLTGDASLRRRPMERIAQPLQAMGARVVLGPGARPPLEVRGPERGRLRGGEHRPTVASAQVKSCILLAGLYGDARTTVHELAPTRDHTERLLRAAGVGVVIGWHGDSCSVAVDPPRRLRPLEGRVPGDVSSAAYWVVAAALLPGSDLRIEGVGLNPSRTAVLRLLRDWGAEVGATPQGESLGEPWGDVHVRGGERPLQGGTIEPSMVPALIDELPLLAMLGACTRDGVEIRGAAELRVKESDRIATTAAALRGLGVEVDEYPDGIAVPGGQGLGGGSVDAAGDHRIALATAAAAVAARGTVRLEGAEAMTVSYPGFAQRLEEVRRR